ncbi:MAG TPA: hypothetical protein VFE47_03270 [Tepidisphaeraceae bacterium]|jgi:hypothetical protein|nr:hypothetical protein [Tepidisphaeraceae bacterium]
MKMTFRQTAVFVAEWKRLRFVDEDLQALEWEIMERPDVGRVLNGTGGVRKMRFSAPSRHSGKSGATRVCYTVVLDTICYLLIIFPKNERANLSARDKAVLKKTVDALRHAHSD